MDKEVKTESEQNNPSARDMADLRYMELVQRIDNYCG